jgi:hypothetical protein
VDVTRFYTRIRWFRLIFLSLVLKISLYEYFSLKANVKIVAPGRANFPLFHHFLPKAGLIKQMAAKILLILP